MSLMTTMITPEPVYVWIVFQIDTGEVLGVFDTEQKADAVQNYFNKDAEQAYYEKHEVK